LSSSEEAGATLELETGLTLLPGTSEELLGAPSELETLFGASAEELPAELEAGAALELGTSETLLEEAFVEELLAEDATSELEDFSAEDIRASEEDKVDGSAPELESSPQATRPAIESTHKKTRT
jgi:hypothetical protein